MSGRMDSATLVSPLTVLVRGVIEWTFPGDAWDALHDRIAPTHQTRKLTIGCVAKMMVDVVAGARRSLFAAFAADQASEAPTVAASHQAVYGRLGNMAVDFSCALVRTSGQRCAAVLHASGRRHLPGWEDFRVRIVDGTQPDGSEHRLKVLRAIRAAGLPCKFVVQYDPAAGLCVDAAAAEDAYASEQKLVAAMYDRAQAADVFVADRGFATTSAFLRLRKRRAFLLVREHAPQLILKTLENPRRIGRGATGTIREQAVELTDGESGRTIRVRRVTVELDAPTESGDVELRLLTNLPRRVGARQIAALYRRRWTIESHFDLLKNHLRGEIESLGKPRAAIFALCISMLTANALAVVKRAIEVEHGREEFEKLSGHYLADELAGNWRAVETLLEREELARLSRRRSREFWGWCRRLAARIRTRAFHRHPRGPKRPRPKRASGKQRHHYSTHRLLNDAKKRC